MSRVIEASGAQLLPRINDPRAVNTSWVAHLCADADLRTKSAGIRGIAGDLFVAASIHSRTPEED